MSPVSGGAGEGRTMQYNHEAFGRWRIVPRMLHGAGGVRQVIENIIAELDLTMACSAFRTSPVSQRISLCGLPEDQPDRGEAAPSTR
jgi:isopentenyl diphosphate isomerase/L-lactate dehydrogenase-like FMN-dependent dehydrogenase